MKRRELLKRITKAAKAADTTFDLDREGGSHSIYNCGGTMIPVPRHNEIGEQTAKDIFKECESALGKDWWK
jgi:hypothetical protein